MSQFVHWGQFGGDPWGLRARSDRDFRLAVTLVLMLGLVLYYLAGEIAPSYEVPGEEPRETPAVAVTLTLPTPEARYEAPQLAPPAKALAEPAPEPVRPKPPAPKPQRVEPARTPQPVKPAPSAREQARVLAAATGMTAFKTKLQSLHSTDVAAAGVGSKTAPTPAESSIAGDGAMASAPAYKGAKELGGPAPLVEGGAGQLGRHQSSDLAGISSAEAARVAAADRQAGEGRRGRNLEEIQLAFERQKLGFYALFNRAARSSGERRSGSVVVSLTISPQGQVTDCRIVSSSFRDPELHEKLLRKVRMLSFESRDVPEFTYSSYPITFIPS